MTEAAGTVGERLRAVREQLVWTQDQLAAWSGVAKPTISRLENGLQQPNPTTVQRLASTLGVTAPWLMHGSPPKWAP